ncbi:hypothetical protein [Clostridium sp.]|uniref:hypothetical protein n=1 Tax=Clostridium sp. TaxID=1506 RepID=UPI002FC8E7DB
MKEFKFNAATKRHTRKQLAISLLMSVSFIITTIGLFLREKIFYGRLFLVLTIIAFLVSYLVIKKVKNIENINYLRIEKDRFELNNNISSKGKIFKFNDISDVRFTMKAIKFRVGIREYRIAYYFLDESDVEKVKKIFERY